MEKARFYWLDLIRFVAALLVVLVHVRSDFFLTYSLLPATSQNVVTKVFYYLNSFGTEAVIVFFVLSGFLVGGKTVERILTGKASLGRYVLDRSVRILVPLVAALLLIVAVDYIVGKDTQWWQLVGNLFSLQGILVYDAGGVFWTLSYEVWFYVLVAGLIMIFHRSRSVKVGGVFVLMLALSCFVALNTFYLFILLFGILAYYLSRYELSKKVLWSTVLGWSLLSVLIHFAAPSKARDTSMFSFINLDMCKFLLGGGAVLYSSAKSYAMRLRDACSLACITGAANCHCFHTRSISRTIRYCA